MKTGRVFRAKEQMKWAGLILLIVPFTTHIFLNHEVEDRFLYWFLFFMIGVIWTLGIYSYVVDKIWRKIRRRRIEIVIQKIVHYHKHCLRAISNNDWIRVKFMLDNVFNKYDPSSQVTYFIKGAYTVGINDIKGLEMIANEIEKAKNECINRV